MSVLQFPLCTLWHISFCVRVVMLRWLKQDWAVEEGLTKQVAHLPARTHRSDTQLWILQPLPLLLFRLAKFCGSRSFVLVVTFGCLFIYLAPNRPICRRHLPTQTAPLAVPPLPSFPSPELTRVHGANSDAVGQSALTDNSSGIKKKQDEDGGFRIFFFPPLLRAHRASTRAAADDLACSNLSALTLRFALALTCTGARSRAAAQR